jgi:hypothetical protein
MKMNNFQSLLVTLFLIFRICDCIQEIKLEGAIENPNCGAQCGYRLKKNTEKPKNQNESHEITTTDVKPFQSENKNKEENNFYNKAELIRSMTMKTKSEIENRFEFVENKKPNRLMKTETQYVKQIENNRDALIKSLTLNLIL